MATWTEKFREISVKNGAAIASGQLDALLPAYAEMRRFFEEYTRHGSPNHETEIPATARFG